VYDLTPERVGRFDVVVCGSLMLHLRDPVRALEAIRGVCDEWFLSSETVSPLLSALAPRRPLTKMMGGELCQWLIPNAAGHRLMLSSAGFKVERFTAPYSIPHGPGNPAPKPRFGVARKQLLNVLITHGAGVPHAAALCRPLAAPPAD